MTHPSTRNARVRRETWAYFESYGIPREDYDAGRVVWSGTGDGPVWGESATVTFTNKVNGAELIAAGCYCSEAGEVLQTSLEFGRMGKGPGR